MTMMLRGLSRSLFHTLLGLNAARLAEKAPTRDTLFRASRGASRKLLFAVTPTCASMGVRAQHNAIKTNNAAAAHLVKKVVQITGRPTTGVCHAAAARPVLCT